MQRRELDPWISGANGQHLTGKGMVGMVVVDDSRSKQQSDRSDSCSTLALAS